MSAQDAELAAFYADLEAMSRRGMRRGLACMREAVAILDHPERRFKIIHLAGTNGKGSTCTFIAHLLAAAGCKVGLTLSPHVIDYRERIQLLDGASAEVLRRAGGGAAATGAGVTVADGRSFIPVADLLAMHSKLRARLPDALELTYFEWTILLALQYFADQRVDFAVVETGMGGRWDATNVCPGLVTGITTIGLDHTQHLGNTLEKILAEKLEIIKESPDFVFGPNDPELVTQAQAYCKRVGARFHPVEVTISSGSSKSPPSYGSPPSSALAPSCVALSPASPPWADRDLASRGSSARTLVMALSLPSYLKNNWQFAVTIVKILGDRGFEVVGGIESVASHPPVPPARLEIAHVGPLVLIDGAHNEPALLGLKRHLVEAYGDDYDLVFGVLNDRDFERLAGIILSRRRNSWAVFEAAGRESQARVYAAVQRRYGGEIVRIDRAFLKNLLVEAGQRPIAVCGSLYLCGQFHQTLRRL